MQKPLSGMRVVDFTHVMAGPFATYFLGLLGAEVIKVESIKGDLFRTYGRDTRGLGMGAVFIGANAGKKSISLDLRLEPAKEAIRRLICTADVVVESFRPGVIDKLGFGYEACAALKSNIVYCSVSGYGQDGPMRNYPAIDNVVQATSGLMSVSGAPGDPPIRIGGTSGGHLHGDFGLILYSRRVTSTRTLWWRAAGRCGHDGCISRAALRRTTSLSYRWSARAAYG